MTQQSMVLCGNEPYMTRGILSYFSQVKETRFQEISCTTPTGLIWLILFGLLELYINCHSSKWYVQVTNNYFTAIICTEMKDPHTQRICTYKQKLGPYLTTLLGPPCTKNNPNLNPQSKENILMKHNFKLELNLSPRPKSTKSLLHVFLNFM